MAVRGTQDSKHLSVSQALDMMFADTSPQNMSPGPPNAHRRIQKKLEERKWGEEGGKKKFSHQTPLRALVRQELYSAFLQASEAEQNHWLFFAIRHQSFFGEKQ